MGMGDKPQPFVPSYEPMRDDVIGKRFPPVCVRSCPHPNVIAKFGVGGVANVSVYTCKKCTYARREKLFDGYRCAYGLE